MNIDFARLNTAAEILASPKAQSREAVIDLYNRLPAKIAIPKPQTQDGADVAEFAGLELLPEIIQKVPDLIDLLDAAVDIIAIQRDVITALETGQITEVPEHGSPDR